ncbi:MAG: class I SAM-dependent methyltransferase, partial [Elusimicrobiota bacterium]
MANKEIDELQKAAAAGVALGNIDLDHLSNRVILLNYVRISDDIAALMKGKKLLDWGCGYGQMTYLLRARGVDAAAYDVIKRENIEKLPIFLGLDIVYGGQESALPFANASFDGALSCGTIEHVPDMEASLKEIYRVLSPGGYFLTYMLPNKLSYTEFLGKLKGNIVHPVKFSFKDVKSLYSRHGFEIVKTGRSGMIPKNLTGMPRRLKDIYGRIGFALEVADRALSSIPLVNLFCGVLEITARVMSRFVCNLFKGFILPKFILSVKYGEDDTLNTVLITETADSSGTAP